MELNSLEHAVMAMLLAGDDPTLRILAEQFRAAQVTKRELTGAGFYTRFSVPPEAPRLADRPSFRFGDVTAEIEGLQHGAGFVLFVDDWVINFLEGFSYDEFWPENTDKFQLSFMGKQSRDFAKLPKELHGTA
jgi:hypothetical protein